MGVMGHTVMACSGDTGAPGWSINFPVDPLARNFPFPCPDCPLEVNLCNQINIKTANYSCNVPSGLYSRDVSQFFIILIRRPQNELTFSTDRKRHPM